MDEDRQREASKERMRRYRERNKGVTSEGVTEQSVTKALSGKELLDSWALSKGTEYQHRLGVLAQHYGQ